MYVPQTRGVVIKESFFTIILNKELRHYYWCRKKTLWFLIGELFFPELISIIVSCNFWVFKICLIVFPKYVKSNFPDAFYDRDSAFLLKTFLNDGVPWPKFVGMQVLFRKWRFRVFGLRKIRAKLYRRTPLLFSCSWRISQVVTESLRISIHTFTYTYFRTWKFWNTSFSIWMGLHHAIASTKTISVITVSIPEMSWWQRLTLELVGNIKCHTSGRESNPTYLTI